MLSYQHGYHAGNFADVVKHITLMHLLDYMTQKEAPLLYLDTHAGRGLYNLQSQQARKTAEAQSGITLLWKQRAELPNAFLSYIHAIEHYNSSPKVRYYPGSPALALYALRRQDRLVCAELHPEEIQHLQKIPRNNKRIFFSQKNGLDELKALLPPIERRALIFMDPSYELKSDYRDIPRSIEIALRRFPTAVYCLWYPIIEQNPHKQLITSIQKINTRPHLHLEFYLHKLSLPGMTGCGLYLINPPYTLALQMETCLKTLCTILNPPYSSYALYKGQ